MSPAPGRPGRVRLAAGAACVLVALVVCAGCTGRVPAGPFSTALGTLLREQRPARVDLATVLPLQWDELFLYGPYSLREPACKELDLGWLRCRMTLPGSTDEGAFSLVFRLNGRIVHHEQHARRNGDFVGTGETRPHPVRRGATAFEVETRASAGGGGGWVLHAAR